jgi:hypothetical protein
VVRVLRAPGQDDLLSLLDTYTEGAALVAARTRTALSRASVIGTVLGEALLNALRLLAQQDASTRPLGPPNQRSTNRGNGAGSDADCFAPASVDVVVLHAIAVGQLDRKALGQPGSSLDEHDRGRFVREAGRRRIIEYESGVEVVAPGVQLVGQFPGDRRLSGSTLYSSESCCQVG